MRGECYLDSDLGDVPLLGPEAAHAGADADTRHPINGDPGLEDGLRRRAVTKRKRNCPHLDHAHVAAAPGAAPAQHQTH